MRKVEDPIERPTKILIVDEADGRSKFRTLINKQKDLVVCAEVHSNQRAWKAIAAHQPDLILFDSRGDTVKPLALIGSIKASHPRLPVLVISPRGEAVFGERVIREGGFGYLPKHHAGEQLLIAIRRVSNGEIYVSDRLGTKLLQQNIEGERGTAVSLDEQLAGREREVLRMIGKLKGTREIARELRLSVKTVEFYRAQIKKKLSLKDGAELIRVASNWVSRK